MRPWLCIPRDTAVFRDGRPMASGAGWALSLAQPWPSAVAGLCRTAIGLDPNTGAFALKPSDARAIPVAGPWFAELTAAGEVAHWLVPAPADALWHDAEASEARPAGRTRIRTRVAPGVLDTGEGSNGPAGLAPLLPCATLPTGKAVPQPPLWTWPAMEQWLSAPTPQDHLAFEEVGRSQPADEWRTHVGIEPASQTARDGALFAVEHRRFSFRAGGELRTLAVALGCDDERLRPSALVLGGERRVSQIVRASQEAPALPGSLEVGAVLRVIVVTPALFERGYCPGPAGLGAGVEVVAAAVGRPQAVSGWDFETNSPKATRFAAPAGSVYWLRFADADAARTWAQAHWWRPISDGRQDQLDGFGLCIVGVA